MTTNRRLGKLEMPGGMGVGKEDDKVTPNQLLTLINFKGILIVIKSDSM